MKTILLIMMICVTFVIQSQPVIHNSIGFKYTPYIQAACQELGIEKDIYVLPTNLLVKGYAVKNGFGGYIIYINKYEVEPMELKDVIAHELCHVRDDIQGVWDLTNPTTMVTSTRNIYVSEEARQVEIRVSKEARIISHKLRRVK